MPYTSPLCQVRPSFLPNGERTPSATITKRQVIRFSTPWCRTVTSVILPCCVSGVNAVALSHIVTAGCAFAWRRNRSSSSVRGMAEPVVPNGDVGQGAVTEPPKPWSFNPRDV